MVKEGWDTIAQIPDSELKTISREGGVGRYRDLAAAAASLLSGLSKPSGLLALCSLRVQEIPSSIPRIPRKKKIAIAGAMATVRA